MTAPEARRHAIQMTVSRLLIIICPTLPHSLRPAKTRGGCEAKSLRTVYELCRRDGTQKGLPFEGRPILINRTFWINTRRCGLLYATFGGGSFVGPQGAITATFGGGSFVGPQGAITATFGGGSFVGPQGAITATFGGGSFVGPQGAITATFGGGSFVGPQGAITATFGGGSFVGPQGARTAMRGGGSFVGPQGAALAAHTDPRRTTITPNFKATNLRVLI